MKKRERERGNQEGMGISVEVWWAPLGNSERAVPLGAHGFGRAVVFGVVEAGVVEEVESEEVLEGASVSAKAGASDKGPSIWRYMLCSARQPSGWFSMLIIARSAFLCISCMAAGLLMAFSASRRTAGFLSTWPISGLFSIILCICGLFSNIDCMNCSSPSKAWTAGLSKRPLMSPRGPAALD